MATPHTGETWWIIVTNAQVRRTLITGDSDDAELSYVVTHNGSPYLTGSLEWESETTGVEDAWSAEFLLPPTPGVCVVEITMTQGDVIGGPISQSLRVV